jgi:hyperosmotically inducible protein
MKVSNIARLIAVVGLVAVAVPVSAQDKVTEGAEKTKDAVVKGTTVAVDKTKDALSKTGEVMTDAWVTTRVHQRFVGESLLKASDISVDSDKHVVTLTGTVMNLAGRRRATAVAKGTEGVRSVVNHLTIGPKKI